MELIQSVGSFIFKLWASIRRAFCLFGTCHLHTGALPNVACASSRPRHSGELFASFATLSTRLVVAPPGGTSARPSHSSGSFPVGARPADADEQSLIKCGNWGSCGDNWAARYGARLRKQSDWRCWWQVGAQEVLSELNIHFGVSRSEKESLACRA